MPPHERTAQATQDYWAQLREAMRSSDGELFEALHVADDTIAGTKKREAAELLDSAVLLLAESMGRRNNATDEVPGRPKLVDIGFADIEKFIAHLKKAGIMGDGAIFANLTRDRWKSYWESDSRFHADLIRYLFRPEVYCRAASTWLISLRTEISIMDKPAPRSRDVTLMDNLFENWLVKICLDYVDLVVRDPFYALQVLLRVSYPNLTILRRSIEFVVAQPLYAVGNGLGLACSLYDIPANYVFAEALVALADGFITQKTELDQGTFSFDSVISDRPYEQSIKLLVSGYLASVSRAM